MDMDFVIIGIGSIIATFALFVLKYFLERYPVNMRCESGINQHNWGVRTTEGSNKHTFVIAEECVDCRLRSVKFSGRRYSTRKYYRNGELVREVQN